MERIAKSFFYKLSQNKLLNEGAKKWGVKLGAKKFVAGTTIEEVTEKIIELNNHGIRCTVDHLGEFVTDEKVARKATENILRMLKTIHLKELDCHLSVKLTQIGLDIDETLCMEQMKMIMEKANRYNIFVNIDMENYERYEKTLSILEKLRKNYTNVGTAIQAYLYRTEKDLENLKDVRIRLVKGAYKEKESVAFQSKKDIDRNFLNLAKKRLLGKTFTSIATHDHQIINELKTFINEHNIDRNSFEFQMLYGFRIEMQHALAKEGFLFCTYIPFGTDWFGYYMRRLAERPQNINLIMKDLFSDQNIKRKTFIAGVSAATLYFLWKKQQKRK